VQNEFIESFNCRLRDEFLNETLFTSLKAGTPRARRMAARLQHRATAFRHRLAHTRLRRPILTATAPTVHDGYRQILTASG